jgi:hypothetical protein
MPVPSLRMLRTPIVDEANAPTCYPRTAPASHPSRRVAVFLAACVIASGTRPSDVRTVEECASGDRRLTISRKETSGPHYKQRLLRRTDLVFPDGANSSCNRNTFTNKRAAGV